MTRASTAVPVAIGNAFRCDEVNAGVGGVLVSARVSMTRAGRGMAASSVSMD